MIRTALAAWVLLSATSALAQDDPVDRQVERLKESLQLTDEQAAKVKEILRKNHEDLRGVLTDEQKQRYDEQQRRGGRGGDGGRGGGFRGFGGGMGGLPSTDELREQLKLTDDQVAKINEIRDEARQEMREYFRNGERPNPEEMQKFFTEIREKTTAAVRELLTDEQKPKFDEIVKNLQGDAPRPGGDRGPQRRSADERVRRAMEALRIENAEEAAAVRDLVKKVVEAQNAMEDFERDARPKLEELRRAEMGEEELRKKLDEIRDQRREKDKAVKDAQKALYEVVTTRQELELIRQGILR